MAQENEKVEKNNVIRYVLFVPVFIVSYILVSFLINQFIYPIFEKLAFYIRGGLATEFSMKDLDWIMWILIIFRAISFGCVFLVPTWLTMLVFPGKKKKQLVLSLIAIHLMFSFFILGAFVSLTSFGNLATINNLLLLIGTLIGYFYSYILADKKA